MRLAPGTRLGSYEVVSGIGAGGMGEVYRAHDTVLNRDVALKLVHPDFCHHPDSLTRLRREARALAALNHPNVATLHELAEFGDSCGLVMELVGGETLADLVRRRRLPVAEALPLAAQIAGALEAAHERGITHRDLKPANIKITAEGIVKVLDFGLAKADGVDGDAAIGSTLATSAGAVIGTAPYMSPEQARGAPIDRRTDIWAFGCVVFEMLTGRLAFDGNTRSDIVAGILEKEPDWATLPADTPAAVRRLLRRCLEKDHRRRIRDIGDIKLELEDIAAAETASDPGRSPVVVAAPAHHGAWLRSAAVAVAGLLVGVLAAFPWQRDGSSARSSEVKFSITLPEDERIATTELGAVTMSPDGRSIVYVAGRGNTTQLMMRALDSGTSRPLPGTFGAVSPFFSPDGEWLGFFADGKLKKAAVAGGAPIAICDAPDGLGGSWSGKGTIVFAAATGGPLQQVAANGGTPTRATELDVSRGEFSHRWPEFLPESETVLYTVGTVGEWSEAEIVAQSLGSRERATVLKGGTNPRFLASGHVAYAHDGAIWVASFDSRSRSISGTPVRALEGVSVSVDGAAQFAISREGASVYLPSVPWSARRLVVVDSSSQTPLAAPPHAYVTPRVSPDGRRVLLGVADNGEHLWSYDLSAGTLTQLTFEAANRAPIWSADGQRVVFASNRNGALNLFALPAGGDGNAERLTTTESLQLPGSWSPDGQTLAFMEQNPSTGRDIWLRRRNGDRAPFVGGEADESAPRFSPDGRWIAYVSNESGQAEVYVRAVNGEGVRRVSADGGAEPVWRRDGSALYYRSYGKLIMAQMNSGSALAPRVVNGFAAEPGTFDAAGYDTMSGERFLMITSALPGTAASELRVVLNWTPAATSSR
jgi:eukaryotic-like serine/threonine-protein kinase